jgi:anti-sigma factor RsiW
MQDYLDETLPGPRATQLFLHVRECSACHRELETFKAMFGMLDTLPAVEPPADFDSRILQAVPYAAYREMAELRRQRVPLILDQEALPVFLRSPATRLGGLAVAAAATAGLITAQLPDVALTAVVLGALPEVLVRLQQIGRRIYVGAATRQES